MAVRSAMHWLKVANKKRNRIAFLLFYGTSNDFYCKSHFCCCYTTAIAVAFQMLTYSSRDKDALTHPFSHPPVGATENKYRHEQNNAKQKQTEWLIHTHKHTVLLGLWHYITFHFNLQKIVDAFFSFGRKSRTDDERESTTANRNEINK